MARNKLATKATSENGIKVTFADGNTLECNIANVPDSVVAQLAIHGLGQKIVDSYAGAESVSEARAYAEATWENLLKGNWASRSRGGILAEAIAQLTGRDLGEVIEALEALDDKEKAALRKDTAVAEKILEIQKSRIKGGSTLDLGALFTK